MIHSKSFRSTALLGALAAIFLLTIQAQSQVLISKIQVSGGTSTDEFIELYNAASSSATLSDWSLKKQTASGALYALAASFPATTTLDPWGYLLVSHRDYQPTEGAAPDIIYSNSSNSLADNNSLLLFDGAGALVDRVDWGEASGSLYRVPNPAARQRLVRLPNDERGNGQDTDDSSQDFVVGADAPFNSQSPPRGGSGATSADTAAATDPAPEANQASTTAAKTSGTASSTAAEETAENAADTKNANSATSGQTNATGLTNLKINEFLPAPTNGHEWVELYHQGTSTLTLANIFICDSSSISTSSCQALTGAISGGEFKQVDLGTARYLNNDGDTVRLVGEAGLEIDAIRYGEGLAVGAGEVLARRRDGVDSNSNSDWAVSTAPTPGAANRIVAPTQPTPRPTAAARAGGGAAAANPMLPAATTTTIHVTASTTPFKLSELFPNPEGSDSEEFIELENISASPVDLTGWKVGDSQTKYPLTGTLAPRAFLALSREVTRVALNNSALETITLTAPDGTSVDRAQYRDAPEAQSFSRAPDGSWHWSEVVTRGAANAIVEADAVRLVLKITAPDGAAPGETIALAAAGADPRGGRLAYHWDFGDGGGAAEQTASHAFEHAGTYTVELTATSSAGTHGSKTKTITIAPEFFTPSGALIISEVLANPMGDDTEEFIELYNASTTTVALAGWRLVAKTKTFTIPDRATLPPDSYAVFYRPVTRFALPNDTAGKLFLIAASGAPMDTVALPPAKVSGASFGRFKNGWKWTLAPTPGEPNELEALDSKEEAATPSGARTRQTVTLQTLSAARALPTKTSVLIHGTVAAPPGPFGKRSLYVTDRSGGILVQAPKGATPLPLGAAVTIAGTLTHTTAGKTYVTGKTITLASARISPPATATGTVADLEGSPIGALAQVAGEVTELKRASFYLDDGSGEIEVALKSGAAISKNRLREGSRLTITGIIEEIDGQRQLWPRGDDDIKVGPTPPTVTAAALSPAPSPAMAYGATTIGGAGLLALAQWLRRSRVVAKLINPGA